MSVIDITARVIRARAPEATFGFAEQDGPRPADVGVERIAPHEWRVEDRRLPRGDPCRVLAYIEYCHPWYEVADLGADRVRESFASLEQSVAHVVATATAVLRTRLDSGEEWTLTRPSPRCHPRPHAVEAPLAPVVRLDADGRRTAAAPARSARPAGPRPSRD